MAKYRGTTTNGTLTEGTYTVKMHSWHYTQSTQGTDGVRATLLVEDPAASGGVRSTTAQWFGDAEDNLVERLHDLFSGGTDTTEETLLDHWKENSCTAVYLKPNEGYSIGTWLI